jgi:hypothetical protein
MRLSPILGYNRIFLDFHLGLFGSGTLSGCNEMKLDITATLPSYYSSSQRLFEIGLLKHVSHVPEFSLRAMWVNGGNY